MTTVFLVTNFEYLSTMKTIFLILICSLFSCVSYSQDTQTPISDTETELYFSDALIYEYQNAEGKKGEFWIYVNPETGRMLFTKQSWNTENEITDEMTDFIVANPDGSYFQFYQDAEDKKEAKKVIRHQLEIFKNKSQNKTPFLKNEDIEIKNLNHKDSFSTLEATGYTYNYLKMEGKEEFYISTVNFNTHLLYAFSKLNIEAKLPIYFDYSNLVTNNQLVVQSKSSSFGLDENSTQKNYQTSFRLVSFEPTMYYVSYKDYSYYEQEGEKWIKKVIPITIK